MKSNLFMVEWGEGVSQPFARWQQNEQTVTEVLSRIILRGQWMSTSDFFGGFNHQLPVLGHARTMPVFDVFSQDAFYYSSAPYLTQVTPYLRQVTICLQQKSVCVWTSSFLRFHMILKLDHIVMVKILLVLSNWDVTWEKRNWPP